MDIQEARRRLAKNRRTKYKSPRGMVNKAVGLSRLAQAKQFSEAGITLEEAASRIGYASADSMRNSLRYMVGAGVWPIAGHEPKP